MKRLVVIGTLLLTISLLVGGIYYPDSPLMWLAATSSGFTALRIGLIMLLGAILVTKPPRPVYLRVVIGCAAVVLLGSVLWMTKQYMLQPIDTVILIETAIIFGIEALEGGVARVTQDRSRRLTA